MTKARFATIGFAYATSTYAQQFKCPDEGCWMYYALSSSFDAIDGSERGPFASASQALTAAHKAYPFLPIPAGHRDWVDAQIAL